MRATATYVAVWAALLVLLAAAVTSSYVATGVASLGLNVAVASAKAGLIFWFYMHMRREGGLVRLAAAGAAAWLLILFLLTAADYVTRATA
ncbi:MAG: cytochrome C oxidase subunit IV family protein [Rhodospirillales bacterium]